MLQRVFENRDDLWGGGLFGLTAVASVELQAGRGTPLCPCNRGGACSICSGNGGRNPSVVLRHKNLRDVVPISWRIFPWPIRKLPCESSLVRGTVLTTAASPQETVPGLTPGR